MDCWIGVVDEVDRRVVRVAGRLTFAHVPELLGACAHRRALHVELDDLVSADAAGIDALQRIRARGAILVAVPGFIRLKIDSPADAPSDPSGT